MTPGKYSAKDELLPGKHCVKAVGKYEPDPNDIYMTEDRVKVSFGKETKTNRNSEFDYNEYIVYNVNQVKIKYLIRVNLTYF